jgi:hypothetical protein
MIQVGIEKRDAAMPRAGCLFRPEAAAFSICMAAR